MKDCVRKVKVCICFFIVRQFLNSGVSPDLFNEDGLTALHQVHTHPHTRTYICITITLRYSNIGVYSNMVSCTKNRYSTCSQGVVW